MTVYIVLLSARQLFFRNESYSRSELPGDFRFSESPQPLPALFLGPFEHVERFRYIQFAVERITNIQSTVLSSSEGTSAIHLAFKYNNVRYTINHHNTELGGQSFTMK